MALNTQGEGYRTETGVVQVLDKSKFQDLSNNSLNLADASELALKQKAIYIADFVPGTAYVVGNRVLDSGVLYYCNDNTSSPTIPSLAGKWTLFTTASPGTKGEVIADANNLYVCTASNSWKKYIQQADLLSASIVAFDGADYVIIKDVTDGQFKLVLASSFVSGGLVSNATHTGDATGATVLTLATVNSNVGSFTNANVTINAKGLVTAVSNGTGGSGGLTMGQFLAQRWIGF